MWTLVKLILLSMCQIGNFKLIGMYKLAADAAIVHTSFVCILSHVINTNQDIVNTHNTATSLFNQL